MKSFHGINVSPGIALGRALVIREEAVSIPKYDVASEQVTFELARFETARGKAAGDLEQLKTRTSESADPEQRQFLDSHILMLNDPELSEHIEKTLLDKKTGTLTLFAFDVGQGLSEHTSPYDATVCILDGAAKLTIDGREVGASAGEMVIMPANIPHDVQAEERFKMLLIMIR